MLRLASTILVVMAASWPAAAAELPGSLDLEAVRGVVVQHDGRWPPLDTLARDVVESVTGDAFHQGHDPVLMLLAWTFDSQTWVHEPLVHIANAELRGELELSDAKTVFSFAELTSHAPLISLIRDLARVERGRKLDPLQAKVSDINDKLTTLQSVFRGQVIKPVPHADEVLGSWRPVPVAREKEAEAQDADPVSAAWSDIKTAFLADDAPAFSSACERFVAAINSAPTARHPDPQLTATELRYNRLRPFRTAWMVMVIGAGLSAASVVIRRRWFDVLAVAGMLAGFGLLTYGLSLRWQIAGRIPASNMFESLLFLSWGMGAFAILSMIALRHRTVPLTASAMGALALVLADVLPLDHFVRPIAPVLMDTVWMSIHVPIIMVSYSVLALGVLIAHVQLLVMAVAPRRQALAASVDSLHYWYILVGSLLLLIGIITGSMWAASSWGRYWGWDPKEVWSLVAFLGYMAILHVRVDHDRIPAWSYVLAALMGIALFALVLNRLALETGGLLAMGGVAVAMAFFVLVRGPFATAVKSIVAFWMIIMTYVGVNYVLGIGLHSYGFGTGAVAYNMFITGGIDLALVALCGIVYLARRPSRPAGPLPVRAPSPA